MEDNTLPDEKPCEGIAYCSIDTISLQDPAPRRVSKDVALQPPEIRRETSYCTRRGKSPIFKI